MRSAPETIDGPFDRRLRRVRRDRAAARWPDHAFLQTHMAKELIERLAVVQRRFSRALILGYAGKDLPRTLKAMGIDTLTADPGFRLARETEGIQCDEDRLPFADATFDLVIAAGTLDTVNDLPGALALIRHVLRPDGLFLGAFLGSGSLPLLRRAMIDADTTGNAAAPRIHPQIDIRSAGDLLGRAGFALQVADGETLTVRYPGLMRLVSDLRGSSNTSLLRGPSIGRVALAAAHASFDSHRIAGKTAETFEIVYMTGWSPSPDQPQPAQRGSGTTSLAKVLKKRN